MTLVVVHTQPKGDSFVTQWQCGNRSGKVVTPAGQSDHPALAAELLALAHLMVRRAIVGNDKGTKPVTFRVSVSELPRAVTEPRSQSVSIRLFSRALRARFADATFVADVASPPSLLPGADEVALRDSAPIDWTLAIGDAPAVVLTEHAVRRVQERHNYANLGYAFRHIRRWVKHELRDAVLPAAVRAEKLARYSATGSILCDDTGWHGVIVNNTLVTMFSRNRNS